MPSKKCHKKYVNTSYLQKNKLDMQEKMKCHKNMFTNKNLNRAELPVNSKQFLIYR